MKKMIKRTSALAISAFMLAQYIPFSAVAYTTTTSDLYIHPYVLTQTDYNTAKANKDTYPSTGKTADETNVPGSGNTVDTGMKFNIVQVDADGSTYSGSGTAVSLTNVSAVASNSETPSYTDLPDGYYKITPANKSNTDARFTDAESFIIQIPVPDSGSVNRSVHIYPKFVDNNDGDTGETTPGQENPTSDDTHNVTLTKTKAGSSTTFVPGAKYNLYYKDAVGNWVAGSVTYTTNASGQIVVTGLPLGDYYFVEQGPVPTGYLLDQTPIPFTIDGATAATVSPTNDAELTVKKNIANDGAGTDYNWVIEADVPSKAQNLLTYSVTDTYEYLTGVTVSSVSVNDGTDTTVLASSKYTVSSASGSVTVTIADLTALIGMKKVIINVASSQNTDSTNTTATNSASISYKYAYNPDPSTDPPIPGITDPDVDPTYPTVINYPTPGSTPDPTDPNSPIDQVTPGTFTISNVNGEEELESAKYVIKSGDDNGATYTSAELSDSTTSPYIVTVSNLAPGHYKIYQTAVDSGHLLNQVPIDIYVGKDGNIYSDEACTAANQIINDKGTVDIADDVANQVKFYNEPISTTFSLPFTGTTATIIFTVTGLILMAGTLFFIIILKKRDDDDEEEQENN